MSISTSPSVSSSTSPSKLPTVSKNDQLEDINTCEHINEEKMINPVSDLIVENSQDKNILNATNNEDDDDKNEDLSEKYLNEKESSDTENKTINQNKLMVTKNKAVEVA